MKTKLAFRITILSLLSSVCTGYSQIPYPQDKISARAIGLGNANFSSVQNPFATINSPAALALMQDMQLSISSFETKRLNFIGLANFFPDIGSFSLSFTRLPFVSDTFGSTSSINRWSFAYGRGVSNKILAGAGVHWNRPAGMANSLTFSASLLAFPGANYEIQHLFASSKSLFNNVILPQKFAIAFAIQDVPFSKKMLDPSFQIGSYYRLSESGTTLFSSMRISENDQNIGIGASIPLKHYIDFFAGIERFEIKKSAIGASFRFPRQSIDFSYSFAEKAFFLDFSTRIGKSPLQRARNYREQGIYYARQREHEKALKQIKKYLSYVPEDTESLILQNWLLSRVEEKDTQINQLLEIASEFEEKEWYIRAALTYKHILKLDNENEYAHSRMSKIKSGLQNNLKRLYELGLSEFRKGNFKTSERAFSTILQIQPNHQRSEQYLQRINDYYDQSADELYYRGLGFYNQKRYDKAVNAFEEALTFAPGNLEAQKYLGLSRDRLNRVQNQTQALLETAQRYEKQNQILNAYQTYKKMIAINPENDEANFALRQLTPKINRSLKRMENRGEAYFKSGELERARSLFQTLLNYDASSNIANTYLTRIEEADKRQIDALYEKGMAKFDQNKWDEAIALFDSLLSIQSNYELAQEKRREALAKSSFDELLKTADAFYSDGKYMKAIDYYEQVQSRVPENEHIRLRIAECRQKLNAFVDIHFSKAINLYAAEDYSGAIRELEAVLEADPTHAGSREYLQKAQKRLIAIETLQ